MDFSFWNLVVCLLCLLEYLPIYNFLTSTHGKKIVFVLFIYIIRTISINKSNFRKVIHPIIPKMHSELFNKFFSEPILFNFNFVTLFMFLIWFGNLIYIYIYIYIYKLATIVEGNPKAPFSIATAPRCTGGRYSFPGLLYFTLDPYLTMLSVKQGGIKYYFSSLWYDST